MRPCELLKAISPSLYLGFELVDDGCIEHFLMTKGCKEFRRLRIECENCMLGRLIRSSALLSSPMIVKQKAIRFLVLYNLSVRKILSDYRDQLIDLEVIDLRKVVLTEKQKQVLRMAGDGIGLSTSTLARRLGVSKPAARKLVRRTLCKVSFIMT